MGLFFWKDNRKIDMFARAMADDMFSYVQPDVAKAHFEGRSSQNKKKQRKVDQKLEATIAQMKQFIQSNSLGIYGKARLQKGFSDRLLELGYDAAITHRLVESILMRNI